MVTRNDIKEHMRLVTKDGAAFMVDHVDGEGIKLTKDDQGKHHWIPMDWVEKVDATAGQLSKTAQEIRQGWKSEAPKTPGSAA
jgi:hypothetical protein